MKKNLLLFSAAAVLALMLLALLVKAPVPQFVTKESWLAHKKAKEAVENEPRAGFPDKAMQWWYEQRAFPLGKIPEGWRENALREIAQHNLLSGTTANPDALSWASLGPGNIGGRIRSILVHPTNPSVIYIGAVAGGVWKTTNGGASWFSLKDDMENMAVCALAMDPNNSNTIYAGTGEGFFNLDAIRGAGIFKSTDAGASWVQLSATNNSNFYYVNKLVFDRNTSTLWVGTRKGLFKTNNGGASFTTVLSSSGQDVHCTDVEVTTGSPALVYAAFGLFNQSSLYRSTDGGTNFTSVLSQANHGRIEVAVSPSNPQTAYCSLMDLNTYGTGIMAKTTNGGANWVTITVPGPSYSGADTYTGQQAWYDNILMVDPSNSSVLYAGGIDFWKSTNGGTSWTQLTNWYVEGGAPGYMHADNHTVAFHPTNASIMFNGNDGGIYKSTDAGLNWVSLNNGLNITQFYYGAVRGSGSGYMAGAQDNGTLFSTGSASWSEIIGGDGGAVEINPSNQNIVYGEYVNLCFFKSTDGGNNFFKSMSGIPTGSGTYDGTTDRTQFISPFSMDPNNPATLVAGTYRVWRTTNNASSWTSISGDLTGDGTGSQGATISTVVVAKGSSSTIYAGCSNGMVQVTTNTGISWNQRITNLPALSVTRIATDPTNPATAFVTFSGYTSGQKVYKTTNYGLSWSNISGNLPNLPANCIVVHPSDVNKLIVGTDLGIFTTTNGGSSWVQESAGIGNIPIADLDYRASDGMVFAATHGRGMFSTQWSTGGGGGSNTEIAYDDGTPSSGYYWANAGQGSANRMTPTIPNAKLLTMSIYFTSVSQGAGTYRPILLRASGTSPGSDYATLPFRTAASVPGWDETDLSSLNITLNADFFIGLKYDGINRPNFGYDPINNGRAWDFNGTAWSLWNETYFMRATIQTQTSDVSIENTAPADYSLSANYPNPFNPSTTFRFTVPVTGYVSITVYDMQGNQVTTLAANTLAPGTYTVTWNGKNDLGALVASGTYIYKMNAGRFTKSRKMVLVK